MTPGILGPPHGLAAILEYFGDPKFNGEDDAHVDPHWEQKYMTLVRMLPGGIQKLYVNKYIVDPLLAALLRATRDGWRPKTLGCFQPRRKRGSTQVSGHALGAAVDIDADANGMIIDCPPSDPRREAWRQRPDRLPDEVIDAFKAEGWTWGGDFLTRFDPMHFQYFSGY